ncbi:hypothetical protein [Cupriavidus sp. USMAHM13]|uniref:hypothetical protein n=1 Tax=Cupriavidus sp. USMAHM13 TaxID=1389192 RepID=UPI0012E9E3DF|nr:hypothetical protein [Cupriavidus sp. USMAHM13]
MTTKILPRRMTGVRWLSIAAIGVLPLLLTVVAAWTEGRAQAEGETAGGIVLHQVETLLDHSANVTDAVAGMVTQPCARRGMDRSACSACHGRWLGRNRRVPRGQRATKPRAMEIGELRRRAGCRRSRWSRHSHRKMGVLPAHARLPDNSYNRRTRYAREL